MSNQPFPRAIGVGRDMESPGRKSVLVAFERELTDDELRVLHDALRQPITSALQEALRAVLEFMRHEASCAVNTGYAGDKMTFECTCGCCKAAEHVEEFFGIVERFGHDEWRSMIYAPLDGTEVELLLHHPSRRYAQGDDRKQWEQIVRAKWIDFNGGGWTWSGMYGEPVGWRLPEQNEKD